MAQLSLNNVIQVIQTYLRDCLKEDAIKIKIQTEDFQFSGISAKRAHFMLSDIPGLKIQGVEFASKVRFHGLLRWTTNTQDPSREHTTPPAVTILSNAGADLLSIKGNNQQQLLDNLRQKLIFITPHPQAPGGQPAGGDILSIVQQLRELNDKVDMVLALLEAHH